MAYIRSKSVGGDKYLYLVKSVWDPKRQTSRQEIIKYLGKASNVAPGDVPAGYRDDPRIASRILEHAGGAKKGRMTATGAADELFDSLTEGSLERSIGVSEEYLKGSRLNNFYELVLRPALYKIGSLWASGEISMATEHISSNVAKELVGTITRRGKAGKKKPSVMICTPPGEEHNIGCGVLQSYLQSRGFQVYDLSPSMPAGQILHFLEENAPDVVFVSVTIQDNIRAAGRLVGKIRALYDLPVLVGGQAVQEGDCGLGTMVVKDTRLDRIPGIIEGLVRQKA